MVNISKESYLSTQESHKEIAKQLWKQMKVQVKKLNKDQHEIWRRLREAHKTVDKAEYKNVDIVYDTEIQILRNFDAKSGAPSPSPH
jgi:HSP90 family molecular chaperone